MTSQNNFQKPQLPGPKIPDQYQRLTAPHFSTPSGMLLPIAQQLPPMYGLRGSTIPPWLMPSTQNQPKYKELIVEHPYKRNPIQEKPQVFCDFCDRSFRGEEPLEKHKLQAHKELMGIKKRVYTEEEINEWKEARKKRYPTTQNILARQQAQEERIKRGERLEEPNSRFGRKRDRRQPQQQKSTFHKKEHKPKNWPNRRTNLPPMQTQTSVNCEVETLNGLPKFQGTSVLANYERTRIIKQTNALSSLGSYGSGTESDIDDDSASLNDSLCKTVSDDELPEETPIVKIDPFTDAEIASTLNHHPPPKETDSEVSARKRQRKRKHSKDDTSTTTENPPENVSEKQKPAEVTPSIQTKTAQVPWFRRYRRYQNTMLEKLLEPEIRHERNVLLQAVRFVVHNNFFGIGNENQTKYEPNTSSNDK